MTERTEWNHVPDVPIQVSPLWQWPPRPLAALKWYVDAWFFLTINGAIVAISFLAYWLASPSLADTATPGAWMLLTLVRNLVIVSAVAGTLHTWFHARAAQGTRLKYDPRPFPVRAASSRWMIS